ncbi:talin-1-like isoform X1 [Vanessa atalanta]|uniref:talin-1-like isoform X1 n=1 Tax=Vanessa atalanta TaxID=42275 RepID=UPI001FCDD6FC|nr:talin-1-like isoform X1 [Vanessa atalanta]
MFVSNRKVSHVHTNRTNCTLVVHQFRGILRIISMAPISLKIVLDDGAVTRTLMFDTTTKVEHAHQIVREKIITIDPDKEYGFFLTSADDERSGIWLEGDRTLEYYMLRDGDSLFYLIKIRNLRLRMLDGSVKTLQVDESKSIQDIMVHICDRIGIPNNEEYGLCREESEPKEESKFSTGTLTLKKKTIQREKDAKLEQLSKKLKTDDNVEWLDQHKTLRESQVDPKETLLFKRRLFYSDRNVDSRDPVQLNLLYVQTRDAILDCRHVVTEDKAAEFAGIQCQVQYGDFQEDKHKPGFIENLKEFLPEQYESSWGIEKKIIKEHRKHQGLSQIEAKHIYTKTARELPTYGVTFFLVKEKQKTKKKLVPRLLGINSESILRLDEETKEILQVWPLTQVKSYRAGSESFTLNFGDYSEKEYAVKTNEAFRIRDILQGYIDIIRKRLAAPYNVTHTEGEVICEEMVESSRGTLTQNVVASKVQTHSLIGPSQIISVDQGQQSQMGTKIVTVHEVITSRQGDRSQQAMRGELKRSNSKVHDFDKKLNRLNSESVRTVVLLSDPTKDNIAEVRNIVNGFKENLPGILKGANETAANLKGDQSKKLLEELDELCAYINTLVSTTMKSDLSDPDNLMTAQDTARKIADLSTQMFFSLDPKSKRRSQLLRRSRNSFILDEKTEASLRRASFITAADNACQAVEHAKVELDEEYNGPPLTDEEQKRLELKTVDKMGKLNAAIALLLNAHADPKKIDYEMAVNSMKTIHELVPDFVEDSKSLLSVGNESTNKKLRGQIIQLLDGARNMCMLTGSNDVNKMHDVGNNYADVSKKLIFTFKRPDHTVDSNGTMDPENQILAIAKEVGEKVSLLLMEADELNNLESNDPPSENLDAAGVKCADATQGLLACAKLTAPTIHEPHCQSALTAAAENLSSSAQNLAVTYKPLVDKPGRHGFAKQLADRVFDLAKALDKLKGAYANLNVKNNDVPDADESELQQNQRLQFVVTSSAAKNGLDDANKELKEMIEMLTEPSDTTKTKNPDARRLLSEKMAQLNAAIASLLQATSDARRPDYDTAGTAINAICHLTPNIINETKALHGNIDDNSWPEITENLKDMLEAIRGLCGSAEDCNIGELNEAASKIANSSGKLTFIFNPRRNARKEDDVLQLSRSAVDQTSHLLANVDQLAKRVGGDEGTTLDTAGVQVVDAAQQLLKTAEITAPSMDDARCQAVLLSAIDRLSDRARNLEQSWKPIIQSPEHRQSGELITQGLKQVNLSLDKLKETCQAYEGQDYDVPKVWDSEEEQKERLKFIVPTSAAKTALMDADKEMQEILKTPLANKSPSVRNPNARRLLSEKMAQLNAAIASLVQATSDADNPDYRTAGTAVNTICQLTPHIINDTKALHGNVDDNSWQEITENLKDMLEATRGICGSAEDYNIGELNEAASKIANSSGKLTFIFNPCRNAKKKDDVLNLSRSAVDQASQLLVKVDELANSVGGDEGTILDTAGVQVVDAAQQLLKTAEITAPSIHDARCQAVLLSAMDRLSDRARTMEQSWKPLIQAPTYHKSEELLNHGLNELNKALDKLRKACQVVNEKDEGDVTEDESRDNEDKTRIQFTRTLKAAKSAMVDSAREIKNADLPLNKMHENDIKKNNILATNNLISQKLAKLNAAIATLLQATSDRERPDYDEAIRAINTITSLTPDIIKDVKPLHSSLDDKSWKNITDNLKSIVDTTSEICDNVDNPQELKQSASKFANSVSKLSYVFNPRNNQRKENQILDLSRDAVEQMSLLLSNVYQLAEGVDGDDGEKLDKAGVNVVDSAQMLLKIAEITSPNISDEHCQAALLSSVDQASRLAEDLKKTWKPLVQTPKHRPIGDQLDQNLNIVQNTLDKLRAACQETEDLEESKPYQLSDLSEAKNKIKEAEKLFSEDKMYEQRALQTGNKNMATADKPVLEKRLQLSQKLAQLNEAVALLLQAMLDRENPDYENAKQTINIISNLTPDIVQETISLQGNMDDNSREILFKEAKGLCSASQEICSSVEHNNLEELNQAATKYAQSSGTIHFIVSPRSYPNKEKKILDISRSACERTSLMLSRVSRLAESIGGDEGENLDISGARVADSAQTLLSTAQVTSPSISDSNCQSALVSSADTLSDMAQDLAKIWMPLIHNPKTKQIGEQLTRDLDLLRNELDVLKETCQDNTDFNEALEIPQQQTMYDHKNKTAPKTENNMKNIDMLLEDIYKHTKGENKQNPIVIEDTPLRQLASKIMESAKTKSECIKYTADERKRFADIANKLADAINKLDMANAKCRDTPFSSREKKERALQLENAILNLQLICIQSRQKDGEISNIVDLTEFVDDVTSAVDDLHDTTKGIKQEHEKEAIKEINNKCQKIREHASKLMNPQNSNTEGNMFDDVLQIDQFAKDCDDQVQAINEALPKIDDENTRQNVKNKLNVIEEKCNLLSFAAKSSISNAESATLEESLRNLEDVEKKIEVIVKANEGISKLENQNVARNNRQSIQAAQSALATVIAAGNENKLPKALARYATQMKCLNQTNDRNSKLKEHLDRLLDALKMQITEKNRRVVTWQDVNDGEVSEITEKILKELESYAQEESSKHADNDTPNAVNEKLNIVNDSDIKSLLASNTETVLGDERELKNKLNQQIQKLNSMTGTIMLSLGKPESLARSLHITSEAASHLSSIARGLKNQDPVQNKRIEEAAQEMSIATYKLLKTSESVCHTPKHPESRRRLLEACSLLNDSLNNLARAAAPADKMQRDCSELARSLQLQQSFLTSENPSCALSYTDCFDAIQNQQDVINKLKSEQPMNRAECGTALRYVSSAICNSAEYASQSAYLLTLSKEDQNEAKLGLVDVPFIKKLTDSINETCVQIICNGSEKETNEQAALNKQVQQLQEAINNASSKMSVEDNKQLIGNSRKLQEALKKLNQALNSNTLEEDKVTPTAMEVIDAIDEINNRIDNLPQPRIDLDPKVSANSKQVLDTTRNLMSKTSMMIRKASSCEEEVMTWFMFGSSDVIEAFESLIVCLREKGAEAGLIEPVQTSEELNAPVKSYVQIQIDSAMSWLRRPASKENVKADGVKGAENIVVMAEQMNEDLNGSEKEEMKQIIVEAKQLLKDCTVKYNSEKASLLMERLRELRKMLERGVVTRVVEDFLEEEPLANLETIVHKENDEKKRKFLLEKKIAELLAQLGRVKKTARFVADTGNVPRHELMKTSDQVELLAPSLVKAAQQRVQSPDDKVAIEHYQKLLAEYADSLSRVRELCDKAVDPIEFSQAAGETMQRIKEESNNDPQKSIHSPKVILRLCKRVVDVGMHSDLVRNDPELKKTLIDIKTAVETKQSDTMRADWRDITAEIMRRTGQVESVLGGENIFLKQPEPDQPIYAAALDLHSAVRGWSARDNEIVAVAKRTAVLMAKLSDYMNTGNKRELIFTSNSIVAESRQVAELAKKLALECSDIRIRTNLLQVCDRIPTISGQLKMLTTVKSSSLGHQGSVEDQEAMNMLVGNAQNLMISIQEVVKAAASASVKIMSQRGRRMKWVQRSYY